MRRSPRFALLLLVCLPTAAAWAGDWPQFRYDAGRTAASPHELPSDLRLSWTRVLPAPRPAFPRDLRLGYDASYEPVVAGSTMFVPSMLNDTVTALDTGTGNERWRFFAGGPVRFAPVASGGRLYFVSDDGYLYCLDSGNGELRWRFRGLPEGEPGRAVIGHGRLVSLWPARGGPVLSGGVVYFGAGLWPTEGVYVHAVDAETGKALWSNVDGGRIPRSNWDHGVGGTAGLSPQGYLAVAGDRLIVPCGPQLPGFLDRRTGELQTYTMGWGGRLGLPKGCWFVAAAGKFLSHAGDLYDITRPSDERLPDTKSGESDYKPMLYPGGWTRLDIEPSNQRELDRLGQPVMTPDVMYEGGASVVARDLTSYTIRRWTKENMPPHRANDEIPETTGGVFRRLWEVPTKLDVHIRAGRRLYAGAPGVVAAIDTAAQDPGVVWQAEIAGTPHRMLAADEKLFVVTAEGNILAFSASPPAGTTLLSVAQSPAPVADPWSARAAAILDATGVRDGYALVLGIDRGRLIEELVRRTSLHVVGVDEDPATVAAVRERLHAMGLYGTRASVLVGNPVAYPFSPYLASLVVSETPGDLAVVGERRLAHAVFHALRPYGGVAAAWGELADLDRIGQIVGDPGFAGARVREAGELVLLSRAGPLPGAADWSHADANAASTGASEDEFLRAPLRVLWFDAAGRWHKFPGQDQVRVAGGRVILLDEHVLRASDVFTGRQLWEVGSPLVAKRLAGPDAVESARYRKHREWGPKRALPATAQLVALEDAIYVSAGTRCLIVDPASGEQVGRIDLPGDLERPWANLRVLGDHMVGSSGANLVCVDRRSGELRWRRETGRADLSLALGKGRVFCAELPNPRRGESETRDGSLFALSLETGERQWRRPGGARLRYSPSLDILVTTTGFYRGQDGEPLPWKPDSPNGLVLQMNGLPKKGVPGYVAGRRLLTGSEQLLAIHELPTGRALGKPMEWNRRGCTGTRASTHLLTTRYRGNSAWIDLESREITPLLGARPGCGLNNNLYPADGVLNIPDLTAGCTCNYMPVSAACVPATAVRREGAEAE